MHLHLDTRICGKGSKSIDQQDLSLDSRNLNRQEGSTAAKLGCALRVFAALNSNSKSPNDYCQKYLGDWLLFENKKMSILNVKKTLNQ